MKSEEKEVCVIIGSISKSKDDILKAKDFFESLNFKVIDPITNNQNKNDTLIDIQLRYVKYLNEGASVVCLVKKPDGTIGESTSYELAITKYLNIPYCVWDGGGKFYDPETKQIKLED